LFREIDVDIGSTVNDKSRFERTSGGESPAGTARFLVLDGGDGTSINPVDVGVSDERVMDGLSFSGNFKSKIGLLEFSRGEVEELGDAVSAGGVFLDDLEVLSEDFNSVGLNIGIRESLVISGFVEFPLLDDFGGDRDIIGRSGESSLV
jgi:hypothetical protein